jgi:hypothetical protein
MRSWWCDEAVTTAWLGVLPSVRIQQQCIAVVSKCPVGQHFIVHAAFRKPDNLPAAALDVDQLRAQHTKWIVMQRSVSVVYSLPAKVMCYYVNWKVCALV